MSAVILVFCEGSAYIKCMFLAQLSFYDNGTWFAYHQESPTEIDLNTNHCCFGRQKAPFAHCNIYDFMSEGYCHKFALNASMVNSCIRLRSTCAA